MMELIPQFHFLRPLWLLMLLPCFILAALLWKQHKAQGNWTNVIAPELLPWLLEGEYKKPVRWPLILIMSGWAFTCLAMAGPTWVKHPVPISKSQHPLAVAVDLSLNMYAADLSPNRLTRVRFKLQDLFNQRSEGLSALVAYAGSAHTVAPLTDDSRTLNNLVKALSPDLMPVQGNNPVEAVKLARDLIIQGSNKPGDILLITGSVSEAQAEKITNLLKGSALRLSILGTGTEQGAPIPLPEGGYLKDDEGTIVVPQLEQSRLQALARANGGRYRTMTLADTDLKTLVPMTSDKPLLSEHESTDQELEQWHDSGYWLVWLLLPLALFSFRRGWLIAVMIVSLPVAQDARAFNWDDLWQTRDQQGQKALQAGNPELASTLFSDPSWKSEALFQNQQFEEAASLLSTQGSEDKSASDDYNRANALAKAGKLQEALKAYDQAIMEAPDMEDAKFNRNLVEQLLNQRSSQDQQNKSSQQQSDQNNSSDQDQQRTQNENSQQSQDSDGEQDNNTGNRPQNSDVENQKDRQNSSNTENASERESEHQAQQAPNQNSTANNKSQQPNQSEPSQESSEENPTHAAQQSDSDEPDNSSEQARQSITEPSDEQPLSPEQQAIESWLRTIPDDPGGLLRRKFLQQQRAQQQNMRDGTSW